MLCPKVDSSEAAAAKPGSVILLGPCCSAPPILDFSQYSGPPGRAFLPLINIIPRARSGGGEGGWRMSCPQWCPPLSQDGEANPPPHPYPYRPQNFASIGAAVNSSSAGIQDLVILSWKILRGCCFLKNPKCKGHGVDSKSSSYRSLKLFTDMVLSIVEINEVKNEAKLWS